MFKTIIEEIRLKHEFGFDEFAMLCSVSRTTIHRLRKGESNSISENVLNFLEQIGYDRDEIIKEYHRQREDYREKVIKRVS